MPERVRITDVSPRDGLQNESGVIPTGDKVRLVELLCATGVDEVELTSFVSPKWVPQLADASNVVEEVLSFLFRKGSASIPMLSALVPNVAGLKSLCDAEVRTRSRLMQTESNRWKTQGQYDAFERALIDLKVNKMSVFTAASETFSKKNTNATIGETIERFRSLMADASVPSEVRGYISCVIACPFEGAIHPRQVVTVIDKLMQIGIREIDLGDTIGAADVASITHLLLVIKDHLGPEAFADKQVTLHLHDTFGRAADCVKAALDMGVRSFDGSVAGLGGCPYASTPGKRAPGNISTELLVRTVEGAGYETGVNLDALAQAADFARTIVAKSRAAALGGAGS